MSEKTSEFPIVAVILQPAPELRHERRQGAERIPAGPGDARVGRVLAPHAAIAKSRAGGHLGELLAQILEERVVEQRIDVVIVQQAPIHTVAGAGHIHEHLAAIRLRSVTGNDESDDTTIGIQETAEDVATTLVVRTGQAKEFQVARRGIRLPSTPLHRVDTLIAKGDGAILFVQPRWRTLLHQSEQQIGVIGSETHRVPVRNACARPECALDQQKRHGRTPVQRMGPRWPGVAYTRHSRAGGGSRWRRRSAGGGLWVLSLKGESRRSALVFGILLW